MAHYAIVESDNIVTDVIVGRDETDTPPTGFSSWEEYYTDFMGNTALRCSYNTVAGVHTDGGTPFRGNFPGPGDKYFSDLVHIVCFQFSLEVEKQLDAVLL